MTTAPTYNRLYNFTNFQTVNPATPLPASQVDAELSQIKVTLDALIANAALIQRSDGAIANASVGPAQLYPLLSVGMAPPTPWSGAGVSYAVNQTVFYDLVLYGCQVAHVSTALAPPTFANGNWAVIADFSVLAISPGSIVSSSFAAGAVDTNALGAGAVTAPKIAANAVTSAAIAAGAVGGTQIAAGAVGSTQIAAGAVLTAAIAAGAVGNTQLAAGAALANLGYTPLNTASNLSDLANASTARGNLGLGTAAVQNVAYFLQTANNLSDVTASTARTNLGLGALAVLSTVNNGQWSGTALSVANGGTGQTSAGATAANAIGALAIASNLSDLNSAAAARTNLGLGTAAVQAAAAFLQTANNLSDVTAATARTNLGLGTAAVQNVAAFLQTANNLSDVTASTARTNLGLGALAVLSTLSLSTLATGTLQAAQMPALTGDVTTTAGSLATTVAKIAGTAVTSSPASGILVGTTDTQTLTNKRNTKRIQSTTSGSTITPTGDTADQYEVTALAAAATIAAPSGTPTDGQTLILRFKDNGTAQTLTWTTTSGGYRAVGVTLPGTTVISKVLYVGCIYNSQDGYWDAVAVAEQ